MALSILTMHGLLLFIAAELVFSLTPGPTVMLQISPVGANAPVSAPSEVLIYQQPAYVPATPVVMAPPGYPGYYLQPFYPPISIGLGFGFGFDGGYGGGHRHRHHGR